MTFTPSWRDTSREPPERDYAREGMSSTFRPWADGSAPARPGLAPLHDTDATARARGGRLHGDDKTVAGAGQTRLSSPGMGYVGTIGTCAGPDPPQRGLTLAQPQREHPNQASRRLCRDPQRPMLCRFWRSDAARRRPGQITRRLLEPWPEQNSSCWRPRQIAARPSKRCGPLDESSRSSARFHGVAPSSGARSARNGPAAHRRARGMDALQRRRRSSREIARPWLHCKRWPASPRYRRRPHLPIEQRWSTRAARIALCARWMFAGSRPWR